MKTTITQIRDLITAPPTGSRHEARANYERITSLQHRAAVIYGEKRGWILSSRPFSLRALHEGRLMRGYDYNVIPYLDHAFFYLDDRRRPAAIIAHLYSIPADRTVSVGTSWSFLIAASC